MSLTYSDAAALLFGGREFTTREFAASTGNPHAAKTLSYLRRRGLVERTGHGRYRCLAPGERPDLRAHEWRRVRERLLRAPLRMAWTGPTAVELWTAGRYRLSPSAVTREFHLAVPSEELAAWRAYLRASGIPTAERRYIGARVRLHPRTAWETPLEIDGEPVISRAETLRLIREHPGLYGGAEAWLRD